MKAWFFRVAYYGIPTLLLLVAVLAFNSGSFLKRPFGEHDDLPGALDRVSNLSLTDQWREAEGAVPELNDAWSSVRKRVRLTSSSDDMEIFDMELAALHAAIEARDPAQVRIAHRRLLALWEDLGG